MMGAIRDVEVAEQATLASVDETRMAVTARLEATGEQANGGAPDAEGV